MRALSAILIFALTSVSSGQSPFVPLVNVPGTSANLPEGVKGVAVDVAGNVFFASGAYTVLRLNAVTGTLTSVAGNGTPGFSGDNGPATNAQLDGVTGIAVDSAGNLYIVDHNNVRIRKVSNGVITTVAGRDTIGVCLGCPATSTYINGLSSIAVDSAGNVYFGDSRTAAILRITDGTISIFAGYQALYSAGNPGIKGAVAVDSAGNLYVADGDRHRIRMVSKGVVTTVAGNGTPGFSGDNALAINAQLTGPRGVAVDSAGDLYIADTGNQRIRRVSKGVITTIAGGGPPNGGLGDNNPPTNALLNFPFGVAVDSAGNVYIGDTLDHRIRKVANGVITTVAGGGSTPEAVARSAGTFAAGANMSIPRTGHTATLLNNGKVLIAGGYSASSYTSAAELYDPAAGTFAATGSMLANLAISSATMLADGRVLIVGTTRPNNFDVLASAELYDPSTGAFTSAGSPVQLAYTQSATLLNNGKVLMVGGSRQSPYSNPLLELYDPAPGTFTVAGNLSSDQYVSVTTTLLASGKVLIANGCGDTLGTFELYDPATGGFSPLASACTSGALPPILLPNGQVLFGEGAYDPASGSFTTDGRNLPYNQRATLLPDGTALNTGGNDCPDDAGCNEDVAVANLYDPVTGTFGPAGNLTTPRSGHQSTLLPNGTVLITGGSGLASAEIYTPPVLTSAPSLFSLSGDGRGQGVIWNAATGQIANSQNPAAAGEVVSMYTTNLSAGSVIPPQVSIGGRLADVLFFGAAPGYPGYDQLNVRVPEGVALGVAVPVQVNYISRSSNEVTIGVK